MVYNKNLNICTLLAKSMLNNLELFNCKKIYSFIKTTKFLGARTYGTGHMGTAQYSTVSGQLHMAHSPSTVLKTQYLYFCSLIGRPILPSITCLFCH